MLVCGSKSSGGVMVFLCFWFLVLERFEFNSFDVYDVLSLESV